jgi:uncharacterized membrane protein
VTLSGEPDALHTFRYGCIGLIVLVVALLVVGFAFF